jgi:Domain of unknown function (DUF4926)
MDEFEMLSVMAVMDEIPEKGLQRGQVGTIVENLAPGVYEVEFSDDQGRTYACAAIRGDRLLRLYHEPKHQPRRRTHGTERTEGQGARTSIKVKM